MVEIVIRGMSGSDIRYPKGSISFFSCSLLSFLFEASAKIADNDT